MTDSENNSIRCGVPSLPDEPTVLQEEVSSPLARMTDTQSARQLKRMSSVVAVKAGQTLTLGTTNHTATAWQWRGLNAIGSYCQSHSEVLPSPDTVALRQHRANQRLESGRVAGGYVGLTPRSSTSARCLDFWLS